MLDEGDVFPDRTVIRGRGAVAQRLDERHAVAGGRTLRIVELDDLGEGRVLIKLTLDLVGRSSGWRSRTTRGSGDRARRPHRRLRDFSDRESAWATASP